MMAVTVTSSGSTLTIGQPRQLFAGRFSMNNPDRGFDVSPDGQRFLMLQQSVRAPDVITAMTVFRPWTAELQRLIPTR